MKSCIFATSHSLLKLITSANAGLNDYRNSMSSSIIPFTTYLFSPHKSSHFATASRTLQNTSDGNKIFEEYAKKNFNLSSSDIATIIKRVPRLERDETLQRAEEAVNFLKKLGCEEADISLIIRRHPPLLRANSVSVKSFEKKVQILKDFGLEGENLVKLIRRSPDVLITSLERRLLPALEFLQTVFQTKDLLVKALVRMPSLLHSDVEKTVKPSVKTFEDFGIKGKDLALILLTKPGLLLLTSFTSAKISYIQKLGIDGESKMLKHVVAVVASSKLETLDEKFRNFVDLGLTSEEASMLFRIDPYAFTLSKEKVRHTIDFIINCLRLPANAVLKNHRYLLKHYLETQIKPRFFVCEKLKIMGLLKKVSYRSVLSLSEDKFLDKYVYAHEQSAILLAVYTTALQNTSGVAQMSNKTAFQNSYDVDRMSRKTIFQSATDVGKTPSKRGEIRLFGQNH